MPIITFEVSNEFKLPDGYDTLPRYLTEKALLSGFTLVCSTVDLVNKHTSTSTSAPVALTDNGKQEIERLKAQMDNVTSERDLYKNAARDIRSVQKDAIVASLSERNEALLREMNALRELKNADKARRDDITRLATKFEDKLDCAFDDFGKVLKPFRDMHTKGLERGKKGETFVSKLLEATYRDMIIRNTSAAGDSGDLQLTWKDCTYLLEIKNKQTVSRDDVTGFDKCMISNRNIVSCGIFISLGCPITGVVQSPSIAIVDGDIPVAYVYLETDETLFMLVDIMYYYSKLASSIREQKNAASQSNDDMLRSVQQVINSGMNSILKSLEICSTLYISINGISDQILSMEKHIQATSSDMMRFLTDYPSMKDDTLDLDPRKIRGGQETTEYTERELNCLHEYSGKLTKSAVNKLLGCDEAYVRHKGGYTKLKGLVAAYGKNKTNNQTKNKAPTKKHKKIVSSSSSSESDS